MLRCSESKDSESIDSGCISTIAVLKILPEFRKPPRHDSLSMKPLIYQTDATLPGVWPASGTLQVKMQIGNITCRLHCHVRPAAVYVSN